MKLSRDALTGTIVLLVFIAAMVFVVGSRISTPQDSGLVHEETASYSLDLSYPTTTPLTASAGPRAGSAALATMHDFIDQATADFWKNVADTAAFVEELKSQGEEAPASARTDLSISYTTYSSPHTLSYAFDIDTYTGGAHGYQTVKTFTFDTGTGTLLTLRDLFTPQSDYLDVVSAKSRGVLHVSLGDMYNEDMLEPGTEPADENFQVFYIDNATLVLVFPPYQVAPYAAGIQQVKLLLSGLADILKSDYKP